MAKPTVTSTSTTINMGMRRFNCDSFELSARFKSDEIKTDQLLEAVARWGIVTDPDEDGDRHIRFSINGNSGTDVDYHAHVNLRFWDDGDGRLVLGFHSGPLREKAITPPPKVCESAAWIGEFFADTIRAHVHVNYTFDKSVTTVLNLPFQLVTNERALAGALVTGYALSLPNQERTTIIQIGTDETYLFVRTNGLVELNLKELDLLAELEKLEPVVRTLIKKAE